MTVVIGAKQYPENIIERLSKNHKVYTIDAGKIANELGNSKVLNSIVLGLAAKVIGFEKDAWLEVVRATVPQKTVEINEKAFLSGYDY
jgi:indolepyruvate ferredoxin oxidoreductase beta subunit